MGSNEGDDNNSKVKIVGIDLREVETIPNAIDTLDTDSVDVLIHNAGLMSAKASVKDIINVNCVSPFVISLCMLQRMMLSTIKNPKILYISSSSHIRGQKYEKNRLSESYMKDDRISVATSLRAYADAKYCSILLSMALQRRLKGTGIQIVNIHPGKLR